MADQQQQLKRNRGFPCATAMPSAAEISSASDTRAGDSSRQRFAESRSISREIRRSMAVDENGRRRERSKAKRGALSEARSAGFAGSVVSSPACSADGRETVVSPRRICRQQLITGPRRSLAWKKKKKKGKKKRKKSAHGVVYRDWEARSWKKQSRVEHARCMRRALGVGVPIAP